jgi:hypothetical protein
MLTIRISSPTIACLFYQYDGQLIVQLLGSSKFNSQEAWRYFTEAVEGRMRHIVDAGA